MKCQKPPIVQGVLVPVPVCLKRAKWEQEGDLTSVREGLQ